MRIAGKTFHERRRDKRPTLPAIKLHIDGKVYETTDWTLGGFRINNYVGERRAGGIMTMVFVVEVGTQKFEHVVDARVVRVDRDRYTMACKFIELEPDAIETLDGWITGRLRRNAKKAQDTARKSAGKNR